MTISMAEAFRLYKAECPVPLEIKVTVYRVDNVLHASASYCPDADKARLSGELVREEVELGSSFKDFHEACQGDIRAGDFSLTGLLRDMKALSQAGRELAKFGVVETENVWAASEFLSSDGVHYSEPLLGDAIPAFDIWHETLREKEARLHGDLVAFMKTRSFEKALIRESAARVVKSPEFSSLFSKKGALEKTFRKARKRLRRNPGQWAYAEIMQGSALKGMDEAFLIGCLTRYQIKPMVIFAPEVVIEAINQTSSRKLVVDSHKPETSSPEVTETVAVIHRSSGGSYDNLKSAVEAAEAIVAGG